MIHRARVASLGLFAMLATTTQAAASEPDIAWRAEIDGILTVPPAVGPTGEIVAQSNELLVIEPDGCVRWREDLTVTGFDRLCDIDDQGRIYATSIQGLHAFDPDGNLLWTALTNDQTVFRPHAGPTVGPDGNVYVLDVSMLSNGGHGFASVTPDGDVRWTFPAEEWSLAEMGSPRRDVAFAYGRAIVSSEGIPEDGDGPGLFSGVKAFTFDGDPAWTTVLNTPFWVTPSLSNALFVPANPKDIWEIDVENGSPTQIPFNSPNPNLILKRVAVDDAGTGYAAVFPSSIRQLNPGGSSSILAADFGSPMSPPAVSPDGSVIVLGTAPSVLPSLNRLTAIDANTGEVLFTIPIEPDDADDFPAATGIPRFSADGRFVYMGVTSVQKSWVYAFDLDPDATGPDADLNGDGDVNVLDFIFLQQAFQNGQDVADINGDGFLNVLDFIDYQAIFASAGCT